MMDETVTATFKIVEPMIFSGAGEFEPLVKGTYTRAVSLPLPLPSTISGAIASYIISLFKVPIPSCDDWIEQFTSVLGEDIKIKGPFIKFEDKIAVGDMLLKSFLTLSSLRERCKINYEKLKTTGEAWEKDENLQTYIPLSITRDVRTGVRLETRTSKSVKNTMEGYLYTAEYVDHIGTCYKHFKGISAEILIEMKGGIATKLASAPSLPIKLGGEVRVVSLSFKKGSRALEEIKKELWRGEEKYSGKLALYLVSPAIFKGGRKIIDCVKEWVQGLKGNFIGMSGESTLINAGFSMRDLKRKPIYTALIPGSMVFIEIDNVVLTELYYEKSLGEAGMLGYGTFIPIPFY